MNTFPEDLVMVPFFIGYLQSACTVGEQNQYHGGSFFASSFEMHEAHKSHRGRWRHRLLATRPTHGYGFPSRPGRSPAWVSNHLVRARFEPCGVQSLPHGELHLGSSEDHQDSIPRSLATSQSQR